MARWLGVDYGKKRIGIAICDPGESFASPAATLDSSGTVAGDARLVLKWARQNEIDAFVVGLPLNMDGSEGPQAILTGKFAASLREQSQMTVELWDERLSSFQADEYMRKAGVKGSQQKKMRDALAAQVILHSFLDARRSG